MAAVNLSPARVDLSGIRAGDRNLVTVRLFSNGVPIDLTGKTVEAQARLTPHDTSALSAIIIVTDEANGLLDMRWPGDAVRVLMDGADKWTGVWDIQVSTPGEDPLTVAAGSFVADMDVARP